jgi:hypothetical protein
VTGIAQPYDFFRIRRGTRAAQNEDDSDPAGRDRRDRRYGDDQASEQGQRQAAAQGQVISNLLLVHYDRAAQSGGPVGYFAIRMV